MIKKIDKPVFIFCLHRSGSTYLKNIIDASPEVKMLEDELQFDHPHFSNTFRKLYKKYCADNINKYNEFLKIIQTSKIRGSFWNYYKRDYGIKNSKDYLDTSQNITVWHSLNSILLHVLDKANKKRVGIKYPTHHKYAEAFFLNFSNAKNIFLLRNPNAIVASKIKKLNNPQLLIVSKYSYRLLRILITIYFSYESRFFLKKAEKLKDKAFIIKYEDLVLDKTNVIKEISKFCEIDFNSEMLNASGKVSGYDEVKDDIKRINRWTFVLNKFEKILVKKIVGKYAKKFRY